MPMPYGCHGFCENAPFSMLIADLAGKIVWANAAAARVFDVASPADLIETPAMDLFISPNISDWDNLSDLIRETGSFTFSVHFSRGVNAKVSLDVTITRPTRNVEKWYYMYLIPVPGNVSMPSPMCHDDERLNLALQCADLGTWDVNLRSGEMVVDGRWARMIGYHLRELMPFTIDSFMELMHPDERNEFYGIFSGWSKGKCPTGSLKVRLRHRNGTWVWIRSQWQVFWSPETESVLRVVGVHQDITNTVKKDEAIHEAQKKIAMLSSVTRHDILNQVTVIRMLFDIMEMTGEVDSGSDTWEQLAKINDAAIAIEHQIGFTRDYEDLGSHPPAWQKLGGMVERVSTSSEEFSHLMITCTCRNMAIYADPMLERVVNELFTNAVQHGGDVTTITVSCRTKTDGTTIIDVKDDGVGVDDVRKNKIFSRGVGIKTRYGLYLAREILSVTGITISETGTGGTGAVFSLFVPQENWKIPRNSSLSS